MAITATGSSFPRAGRVVAMLSLFVMALALDSCEDFRADRAYRHGDYSATVKRLRYLAEEGEPRAQFDLGLMYDKGQGVRQDDQEALRWYRMAAEQGEPRAQYNLGLMYANGQGVAQDYVEAFFWINLAAAQGDKQALDARDYLDDKMTPEQIAEAKRRTEVHERQPKGK